MASGLTVISFTSMWMNSIRAEAVAVARWASVSLALSIIQASSVATLP